MSWNRFLTTRSWRLTQGNGHWLCLPEAQWNYPQSYQHSLRFPVFFCPTSLHKVKKCPTQLNMSGKSKPGLVVDSFQNEGRKVDGRVGQSDVLNCHFFDIWLYQDWFHLTKTKSWAKKQEERLGNHSEIFTRGSTSPSLSSSQLS